MCILEGAFQGFLLVSCTQVLRHLAGNLYPYELARLVCSRAILFRRSGESMHFYGGICSFDRQKL